MLKRLLNLEKELIKKRVLIVYGPRRVGKTTLLKDFLNSCDLKYKIVQGENIRIRELFNSQDFDLLKDFVDDYDLIAIDEAQEIPNIGKTLKIIIDEFPDKKVIATGSAFFDLNQKIGEPLTGRKKEIVLYPLSIKDLSLNYDKFELREKLEELLIFGAYPEVLNIKNKKEKIEILEELTNSYLLKDIISFDRIKASQKLYELLKLLAFQIGNLVSLNELSNSLNLNIRTVERYLDLLEKSFVIKKLYPFDRNLRNTIKAKAKYYFLDLGIRNSIISQYSSLNMRNDIGGLFENFFIIEKIKKRAFEKDYSNFYFWRDYKGKEIDLIEEKDGRLICYEIKWKKEKVRFPKEFKDVYPEMIFNKVNLKNYLDYLK